MKKEIRERVLQAIASIKFYTMLNSNSTIPWDAFSKKILKVVIEEGVLTEREVLRELDSHIKILGRKSFEDHVLRGRCLDLTRSPEAFAYALYHNEFSKKEEASMCFENGETATSFIEYNRGMVDWPKIILMRLLPEQS